MSVGREFTSHSSSGGPLVHCLYEPDTGSWQYICADPATGKCAIIDPVLDFDPAHARFFAQGEGDRFLFDLPAFGLHRLREAGVKQAEWTRHCTYSDPARFYSYRRTTHAKEADYGRLIAAIAL